MISVHLPFAPIPWSAATVTRYGAYDKKACHKKFIRVFLKTLNQQMTRGYVALAFKFIFTIPKSASKKNKALMLEGKIPPTQSDCTNLQKLHEDCLKGILIEDDRKVAKIFSEKVYGENAGIDVKIYSLEEWNHVYGS